jgi:hypothetical protein
MAMRPRASERGRSSFGVDEQGDREVLLGSVMMGRPVGREASKRSDGQDG